MTKHNQHFQSTFLQMLNLVTRLLLHAFCTVRSILKLCFMCAIIITLLQNLVYNNKVYTHMHTHIYETKNYYLHD